MGPNKFTSEMLQHRADILWDIAQGGMNVTDKTQQALDEAIANATVMVYVDDFMSRQTIDEKALGCQYEQYRKALGNTEYELCFMTVRQEADADAAVKEYLACHDFRAVAKRYSVDALATRGGYLGWTYEGHLTEAVRNSLMSLQPNQISLPITTLRGVLLVCFLASRKVVPATLYDIRPQLEEAMRAERLGQHLIALRQRHDAAPRLAGC